MLNNKDSFIVRKKYWNQIQKLTANQKAEFIECMFSYQNEWSYESEDGAVCMLLDIMIDEWKNDDDRYSEICEKNRENWKLWGAKEWNQNARKNWWKQPKQPNATENNQTPPKQADNDSDSDYSKEKEIDKSISKKKESEKISPSQLVKAYESNELLVKMIWDSEVVKLRAEYKQRKKNRAYKTIKWFIQWLLECVNTVRFWQPRWDTAKRFEYAINQAEEHERKSLVWNEITENKYQNYKKTLALTQRQNE